MSLNIPSPALLALSLAAACAPAGETGGDAVGPDQRVAAAAGNEALQVEPVPDIDPETGIDRNVIYQPQIGPEQPERPRKDAVNPPPKE